MVVGHTHRISNLQYGKFPIVEGINAGTSFSVLQLMVRDGDVAWIGASTRVAKAIGVAPARRRQGDRRRGQRGRGPDPPAGRRDPGRVDLPRPGRGEESAMGNLVADAMLDKYAGRGGGRLHQLRRVARGHPVLAAQRRRRRLRHHARRAVRGPPVRQRDRRRDPDRGPDAGGVHERVRAVLRQHRPAPADSRRSRASRSSTTAVPPRVRSSSTTSGRRRRAAPSRS